MSKPRALASFAIVQDGLIVAEVCGGDRAYCLREIMHYAMVYAQDGPCTITGLLPEDWTLINPEGFAKQMNGGRG